MIFGRRDLALGNSYSKDRTFEFSEQDPVWKITVACTSDVIMEVSERYPPTFVGSMDTEVELEKGTHSISFVNEVHGIRFKAGGVSSVISFRVYGPRITN